MMAIAAAKVAHHATGKEKFKAAYDRLVEQFGVRDLQKFKTGKDFDDDEHVLCHFETLSRPNPGGDAGPARRERSKPLHPGYGSCGF